LNNDRCTRWFLPLLILPLPTASPSFLLVFLLSLILHARPCFYCILLLIALFTSSCYWQPVPTLSLLERHPSVLASLTNDTLASLPNLTPLRDRCWCDVTDGNVFEPFNVSKWEEKSLRRMLKAAQPTPTPTPEKLHAEPTNTSLSDQPSNHGRDEIDSCASAPSDLSQDSAHFWLQSPITRYLLGQWNDFRRAVQKVNCEKEKSVRKNAFVEPPTPEPIRTTTVSPPDQPRSGMPHSPVKTTPPSPLPLLRRKYDLSEYGIDIILDLGFGRLEEI